MKTAISIPDELFHQTDQLAQRLKKPRSQVVADALREYLDHHATDSVTEALNRVYAPNQRHDPDPAVTATSIRVLRDVEW